MTYLQIDQEGSNTQLIPVGGEGGKAYKTANDQLREEAETRMITTRDRNHQQSRRHRYAQYLGSAGSPLQKTAERTAGCSSNIEEGNGAGLKKRKRLRPFLIHALRKALAPAWEKEKNLSVRSIIYIQSARVDVLLSGQLATVALIHYGPIILLLSRLFVSHNLLLSGGFVTVAAPPFPSYFLLTSKIHAQNPLAHPQKDTR